MINIDIELGSTDLKRLLISPQHLKLPFKESGAMRIGSALHSRLLLGEKHYKDHFVNSNCKTACQKYSAIQNTLSEGVTALLEKEWQTLEECWKAYKGQLGFAIPDDRKKCKMEQVFRYKKEDDITLRATPDVLVDNGGGRCTMIDVKTTALPPHGREAESRYIYTEKHYLQLAMYGYVVENNYAIKVEDYKILIIPTVPPYVPKLIPVDELFIEMGLLLMEKAIDLYKEYKGNDFNLAPKNLVCPTAKPRNWMIDTFASEFQIEVEKTQLIYDAGEVRDDAR